MKNQTFAKSLVMVTALFGLASCKTPDLSLDDFSLSRKSPAPVVEAPLRQAIIPIPPSGVITVQQGDTIYAIAARYQVTPNNIIRSNNIGPPYMINAGQQLKLSAPRFHVVQAGDSIFSISQRYAVSQFQLAQTNGLDDPFELRVGQKLMLPAELDFSILETGLPTGIAGANTIPAAPAAGNKVAGTDTAANSTANSGGTAARKPKNFVAPASGGAFTWPLQGQVVAEFGPAARGVHNDGVNIAANAGAAVSAAATGTVAFVGRDIKSFGTLILVKHDGGLITAYAHLDSVAVKEGDVVSLGDPIGTVGQTGKVDSPQLHFEIRKSRRPIDPRSLIT